jgi:hypothetical protein
MKKIVRWVAEKLFSFLGLLLFSKIIFPVKEVKREKDKKIFHQIWTSVWQEEGYAHEGEPLPEIEAHYQLFDPYSTDILIWYLGIIPIGTARIIWPNNEVGLPVLNDFEVAPCWNGLVAEITLLTLKREWRGIIIPTLLLFRKVYKLTKEKGLDGIVMAADIRLFRFLRKMFPIKKIGKEKFYEGSITVPCCLIFSEAERIVESSNPKLYYFFR